MAQHHAGVNGQVLGRRKESRVAGDAAELEGPRVVDLALHPFPVPLLGRGGSPLEVFARKVSRLLHYQRLENVLAGEIMDVLAAQLSGELAEHDV